MKYQIMQSYQSKAFYVNQVFDQNYISPYSDAFGVVYFKTVNDAKDHIDKLVEANRPPVVIAEYDENGIKLGPNYYQPVK